MSLKSTEAKQFQTALTFDLRSADIAQVRTCYSLIISNFCNILLNFFLIFYDHSTDIFFLVDQYERLL